jgi:ABC-type multidrug transport system fused ATPase/permease subunit
MDDGKMAEFDSPQRLLAVPTGVFKSLWDKHIQSHGQDH